MTRCDRLQCSRLRATITAGWWAVLARPFHFSFRCRHVGDEFIVLVQSLEHGLADDASGIDVALAMHPADHAALPELVPTGTCVYGSVRNEFGQHFAPHVAE